MSNDRSHIDSGHPEYQRDIMRQAAWDMYAAAALGMTLHPGTTRDAAKPRSIEEIAYIADQLLEQRDKRFGPLIVE